MYAASGGTLYGEPEELPAKEAAPHRPLSPYGVSKMVVCDYLVAYRELYDIEFTALALANVYGPRQDPHGEAGVIAIWSERLVAGEPCIVNGDGRHTRDYVYVDDVVDAFARAADRGSGLILNVGTGIETSNIDLYRAMAAAAGVDGEPVFGPPRPGDVLRSAIDPGRAEIHLGWKPWTSLSEGVGAVIDLGQRKRSSPCGRTTSALTELSRSQSGSTPRTTATGMPRALPITSSAADAISSAMATSVT